MASNIPTWQLCGLTIVSAELTLFLVRSKDIQVVTKTERERTAGEQKEISRGLLKSLLLEILVFVPASAALVLVVHPLFRLHALFSLFSAYPFAYYGVLGIVSYGFPFASIRRAVTRIALNTLKEFASISHTGMRAESEETTRGTAP